MSNTSSSYSNLSRLQSNGETFKAGKSSQASSSPLQRSQPTKSSSDKMENQMSDDEKSLGPFTKVSRPRHCPPVVRRSTKPNTVDDGEVKDGLFDLVKLSHQPSEDLCDKSIPNVEHTRFKNDQMQADVSKYNEAVKEELAKKGVKVHFVKVFLHKEGDLRSTTVARVGCYAADEWKIMDAGLWPANVTVRPWQYSVGNMSSDR